jgi:hypothetical protein
MKMYALQTRQRPARPSLPGGSLLGILLSVLVACSAVEPFRPPSPDALERLGQTAASGSPGDFWPADPAVLESALGDALVVEEAAEISSGLSRPLRLTVRAKVPGRRIDVKWKRAPDALDVINNSPRKEIAAYALQKLVLAPRDFVIPTTVLVCLPPDAIPGRLLEPQPTVPGECVVGALQAWLADVEVPARKLETGRFWGDPAYAYHAANLNLVTVLIDHSDSHRENLLHSADPENPRMFSVDNGISFGSWFRNPFVRNWNRLRVPALRAETIDLLRALDREDLEGLGVVAQLDCGSHGRCVPVEPGENLDPSVGVRVVGSVVQLGLTEQEIEGVWQRRQRVLRAVDSARVAVF